MTTSSEELHHLLAEMAALIEQSEDPDPQLYTPFFHHPEFAFQLIELINNLDEDPLHESSPLYSACVFALDICVAQLQAAVEANNKVVTKSLNQLMDLLASLINTNKHSLNFWLPVLNAFYEVHVELTQELKDAYFDLASNEDDEQDEREPSSHLESIRDLIHELSDLSVFDIAENFFAQSYAMPAEFFADLLIDLYSIEEGQDIALLILLHPKEDVRTVAVATLELLIDQVTLSSISLSRLQIIKYWYDVSYHATFDRWIKTQRKKGVVFAHEAITPKILIRATEIDGTGSQGIFIQVRTNKKNRLCGLLVNEHAGIKDAWITPTIPAAEVKDYYKQAFTENVTIREVDMEYFELIVEHFLAKTVEHGDIPYLHFLEIQELLGLRLRPNRLDLAHLFEQLSVQIVPFTQEVIDESLQRSKSWLKSKAFTESWYIEDPLVDKIVNHNSSFIEGVKVCRMADAIDAVFAEEMELNRDRWQFHFLWVALWCKAKARKNEKIWQDSFLIAHTIHEGTPLNKIPVMQEICRQTVINSVETMQERRTHLSQE